MHKTFVVPVLFICANLICFRFPGGNTSYPGPKPPYHAVTGYRPVRDQWATHHLCISNIAYYSVFLWIEWCEVVWVEVRGGSKYGGSVDDVVH